MHHHVGAQLQRALQVRGAIGVVDNHQDVAAALGNAADRSDIHQLHVRVGRRFEVDHPRCGADRRFQLSRVGHVHMLDHYPELTDAVVQQGKGAAIQGTVDDDFIARAQQGPEGGGNRTHAGAEGNTRFAVFQRRHACFQQCQGRVGDTRIKMPVLFTGKTARTIFSRGKGKS